MALEDFHLAYFPLLSAVEKSTVESGFVVPVYDVANNEMGFMSTQDLVLNPTEEFLPYRGSTRFKDSPVQFDVSENLLISSVPAVVPWSTQNVITSTADIAAHIQRVYVRAATTLTLQDRGSSGIPVVIRVISGSATIGADVGTVENNSLTVGQSSTTAFDPIDEVWYEE